MKKEIHLGAFMKSGLILFAIFFFMAQDVAFAAIEFKANANGICQMIDGGRIMRNVDASYCIQTGEIKPTFSSLDNSSREQINKESGRAPSLEVFYRRRASQQ